MCILLTFACIVALGRVLGIQQSTSYMLKKIEIKGYSHYAQVRGFRNADFLKSHYAHNLSMIVFLSLQRNKLELKDSR